MQVLALGLKARLVPASPHDVGADALDAWVRALATGLGAGVPSGRVEAIGGSVQAALRKGQQAHAPEGVVWITPESGRASLFEHDDLSLPLADPTPLTDPLWIQALEPDTRVSVQTTQQVLAGGSAARAVEAWHGLAFRRVRDLSQRARALEKEQTRQRADLEQRGVHDVLSNLSGLLEAERATLPFAGLDRDDMALAACQIIGRELGVAIQPPPKGRPGRQARDAVEAVAEASKMRVRTVMLRGEWWRESSGPLVARLSPTDEAPAGRAVALVEEQPARYVLLDPLTQTTARVTADVAAALRPAAYMFVAPFPDVALTPRVLWSFATRGMRREQRTILLAGLGAALLGLVVPLFSKLLFDEVIPLADRGRLLEIALLLFVFALVASALVLVRGLTLLRLEARAEQQVEAALMDRMLRLPLSFFKRFQAGDLAERVLGVSRIRRILTETAFGSSIGGVFSFVNLGLLFYFDVRLALIGLALAAVSFAAIVGVGVKLTRINRQILEWSGKISGEMLQFMNGIAKLRVAGAEQRAFTRWAEKFAQQKKLAYQAGRLQNNFEIFTASYPILTSIVFFAAVYAFSLVGLEKAAAGLPSGEALSTGSFIAVLTAFGQFLAGILGIGMAIISVLEVTALYDRAKPILDELPEVRPDSKDPGTLSGEIEVSHVTFRYDSTGPVILSDVSLHVRAGEMVALVGASGSGKSTLFRLLLGLDRPTSGSLYFDGQDLAALDIDAVRRQIGTVLQSDTLRPGSLYGNIVGSSALLTLDDAWEAARLAGLDADIEAMPMGMHTVVGEGGSTFSGGQQQRLMIARALIHRPRILLLDEATSALDNRTQQIVTDSLSALQVTRIVIAHRLSTIRDADRICVLEAGRIAEIGTYDALMGANGHFARLARRQLVKSEA